MGKGRQVFVFRFLFYSRMCLLFSFFEISGTYNNHGAAIALLAWNLDKYSYTYTLMYGSVMYIYIRYNKTNYLGMFI